jgi:hypothetical protein
MLAPRAASLGLAPRRVVGAPRIGRIGSQPSSAPEPAQPSGRPAAAEKQRSRRRTRSAEPEPADGGGGGAEAAPPGGGGAPRRRRSRATDSRPAEQQPGGGSAPDAAPPPPRARSVQQQAELRSPEALDRQLEVRPGARPTARRMQLSVESAIALARRLPLLGRAAPSCAAALAARRTLHTDTARASPAGCQVSSDPGTSRKLATDDAGAAGLVDSWRSTGQQRRQQRPAASGAGAGPGRQQDEPQGGPRAPQPAAAPAAAPVGGAVSGGGNDGGGGGATDAAPEAPQQHLQPQPSQEPAGGDGGLEGVAAELEGLRLQVQQVLGGELGPRVEEALARWGPCTSQQGPSVCRAWYTTPCPPVPLALPPPAAALKDSAGAQRPALPEPLLLPQTPLPLTTPTPLATNPHRPAGTSS